MMQNVNELRRRYASGMVKTEAGNEVSLEELNFEKCIIGSDEAGKGEIFRPLITAAACVRPENMEKLLASFPVSQVEFHMPKWVEMLKPSHWLKKELIDNVRGILAKISVINDITSDNFASESEYIKEFRIEHIGMENGRVKISVVFDDSRYYQVLSELVGVPVEGEYQLIHLLKEYAAKKNEIGKISDAWNEVHRKGYGVINAFSG